MAAKNRSTKTFGESVFDRTLWALVLTVLCRIFILREVGGYSMEGSFCLLIACVAAFSICGLIFRYDDNLNSAADFFEPAIGAGWFSGVCYAKDYPGLYNGMILLVICYLVFQIYLINNLDYKGIDLKQIYESDKLKIVLSRASKAFDHVGFISGIVCVAVISIIAVNNMLPATANADIYIESSADLMAEYSEIGYMFDRNIWEELNQDEREDILKRVIEVEKERLGIRKDVTLTLGYLDFPVLGYYDSSTDMIVIDIDHVNRSEGTKVLKTVLHEVYHVYERQLTEVYMSLPEINRNASVFDHCDEYMLEYENYVSYDPDNPDTYETYRDQYLESDSRDYADKRFYDYMDVFGG